jgi:hypothetical protein
MNKLTYDVILCQEKKLTQIKTGHSEPVDIVNIFCAVGAIPGIVEVAIGNKARAI